MTTPAATGPSTSGGELTAAQFAAGGDGTQYVVKVRRAIDPATRRPIEPVYYDLPASEFLAYILSIV